MSRVFSTMWGSGENGARPTVRQRITTIAQGVACIDEPIYAVPQLLPVTRLLKADFL